MIAQNYGRGAAECSKTCLFCRNLMTRLDLALELGRIVPAKPQFGAVRDHKIIVAVRPRFEFSHLREVHDRRSVDANEDAAVQLCEDRL